MTVFIFLCLEYRPSWVVELLENKYNSSMSHWPTYFESKGRCIYCGIRSDDLTDEHIVPRSLGGQHVIRKASCKKCAVITSKFERKVARDLWGDARISFNAPSYRKNKRPTNIIMESTRWAYEVPVTEYPAAMVFYQMPKAWFLQWFDHTEDISSKWKLIAVDDETRRNNYLKKYGESPRLKFRHIPEEFGRMIAKIWYGQILTTFHPSEFTHICLPYILGEQTNVSFVVGGGDDNIVPVPDIGYSLNTTGIISQNRDRLLLIAKVRIYSNVASPEYEVIVGEFIGEEAVNSAIQKLGWIDLISKFT